MGAATTPRGRIMVDGRSAVILEAGDASASEVIVILASMLVRGKSYLPLIQELARRSYRVMVIEAPGCGRASPLQHPWAMQAYADWLAHCIEKISPDERPILIGHSNAGPPVLLVAAQHPELLRAAVLCDSTGADVRFSLIRVLLGRVTDSVMEWRLTLLRFHHALYNLIFHTRNCLRQIYLAARYDARETARTIAIPALIAWGARDHTFPPACGRRLADCIERSTFEIFDRGSHDWLITHPCEFANVVSRFLEARSCAAGATRLDTASMRP